MRLEYGMRPSTPARALLVAACLVLLLPGVSRGALPAYADLDSVLVRNVRNGVVDYDGIRADPAFERFVRGIATAEPRDLGTEAEALAFYINAYNALAIRGILDGYSPETRRGRRSYFHRQTYPVLGSPLNLADLETQAQRTDRDDPRVHFALVCTGLSCPRLATAAYRPELLEQQLEDAARAFANDGARNRYDVARKVAWLSPVYEENQAAFEAAAGSVQKYLARYVEDPAAAALLLQDGFRVEFTPRDWGLNGTDRSRSNES